MGCRGSFEGEILMRVQSEELFGRSLLARSLVVKCELTPLEVPVTVVKDSTKDWQNVVMVIVDPFACPFIH